MSANGKLYYFTQLELSQNLFILVQNLYNMEMRGIEPRAFHMQSERSTTELHPQLLI